MKRYVSDNAVVDLPKWVENKYDILWESFKDSNFTLEEATSVFEKNKDTKETVPVFLSELRKAEWLQTQFDPVDSRKRIYKLKSREQMITEILTLKHVTRGDLEHLLKKAADLIRTRVDYKFILVLLFLKRVSDKWESEYEDAYNEAISDGLTKEEAMQEARNSSYHDFDLPEEFLWDNIRNDVRKLPENFSNAMKRLVYLNADLSDVLDNVDFVQFAANRENSEILRQLVELFSERKLHHVSPDILGDAYEWILRYFAPEKAKEGEVYTPREVIELYLMKYGYYKIFKGR